MSINQEQDRQRSKSKKKGISVSLTPCKPQSNIEISSFEVSRCTVNHINQLPKILSQSSNSKNTHQVHFSYHSPHPFSPAKDEHTIESSEIKWPESVNSILKNDEIYARSEQKVLETTGFEDKRKSIEKSKFEKSEIRSSVFTVVEEISSKIKSYDKKIQPMSINPHQNKNYQTSAGQVAKSSVKNTPTKKQARPTIQSDFEMIPQKTLETSHQLSSNTNIYEGNPEARTERVSYVEKEKKNTANSTRMPKERMQRLKLAEQKLINIIKVCDYGL